MIIMKKTIYKFLMIAAVVFAGVSCEESDLIIDEVLDGVDTESGAIVRTLQDPLDLYSILNPSNDTLFVSFEIQQGNGSFEPDFKELRMFAQPYEDQDLVNVVQDGAGNDVPETLVNTYPAESFESGRNGLPVIDLAIPTIDIKDALNANAEYTTPSFMVIRLELEMNNGTVFTDENVGATIAGQFFNSPYLYRLIWINDVDITTTYTADVNTAEEGDTVTYTVSVSNDSPKAVVAKGISVENVLPDVVTLESASGDGSYDATENKWTVGDIAPGATATIVLVTTVNDCTAGENGNNSVDTIIPFQQDNYNNGSNDEDENLSIAQKIFAEDDDLSASPFVSGVGGTTATSIFDNDNLEGDPIDSSNSTATITNDGGSGATLNADGTITIPAETAAGTYSITYSICRLDCPNNCDTATVTIVVDPADVNAVNDDFSGSPITSGSGGFTASIYTNDTINGNPITAADVIVTLDDNDGTDIILHTAGDGTLAVPVSTPPGTYTLTYTICRAVAEENCDSATVTIVVN